MTATERLRQLLDKLGVEWEALPDQQEGDFTITATRWHDGEGGLLTMFISEPHGSTWDFFWLPTPEQAVAATLGTSQAADEWGDGFRAGCDAANGASRESVEHYKAENAKLREQMERLVTLLRNDCDIDASWDGLRGFWLIGLTEDGCLMRDCACKAEAENDKLRELLSVMAYCNQFRRDCDGCSLNGAAGIITERAGCDELLASLRELGVEVD